MRRFRASATSPVTFPPALPSPGNTPPRTPAMPLLDPVQVGGPREPEPEPDGDHVLAALHPVEDVRVGERDAPRRRVPEPVQVDHDPLLRDVHLLGRRAYDARVCLVRDDELDVVGREAVAGEELLDHLGQDADGELEDLAAVLVELVRISRLAGAPERGALAVGTEDVVYKARLAVAGVEQDGPGPAAEEDSRGAIGLGHGGAK